MKLEELQVLKSKNPDCLVLEFDCGKTHAIFKKPTRAILGLVLTKGKGNPVEMVEVLMQNCWLGGDKVVREDVGYLAGLLEHIDTIIGTKRAELKN